MKTKTSILVAVVAVLTSTAFGRPPALEAQRHIPFGCVIDALMYIDELANVQPDLTANLITIKRGAERHTMTLITDSNGDIWVRDEYVGVAKLDPKHVSKFGIQKAAYKAYQKAERRQYADLTRQANIRQRSKVDCVKDRFEAVRTLKEMIPMVQIFEVGDHTLAVFERDGKVFVYVPDFGTQTIKFKSDVEVDVAKLARTVAHKLKLNPKEVKELQA